MAERLTGLPRRQRLPDRHRHRPPHDAARVARPRHARGHAVRARPHLRPDRPVPAGQPRAPRARTRLRRLRHRARRRGADGARQRQAGGRPGRRLPAGSARAGSPRRSGRTAAGGTPGRERAREHRRRHRDRPGRRGLPRLRAHHPRSTARRTTGARSCCRPSGAGTCMPSTPCAGSPTTSSTPRAPPGPCRSPRRPTGSDASPSTSARGRSRAPDAGPRHRRGRPQRAHVRHPERVLRPVLRRDGPGPHDRRPTRRGTTCSATWTARPPSSAR